MGFNVWEAPIYRLIDLEIIADRLTAAFSQDWYSQYRFLGGPALMDELIQALIITQLDVNEVLARRTELLPLHEQLVPEGPVSSTSVIACAVVASSCSAPWLVQHQIMIF